MPVIASDDNTKTLGAESMHNIAIFASGDGSNAENIVSYFREHPDDGIGVTLILCNRSDAYVVERAQRLGIPCRILTRTEFNDPSIVLPLLNDYGVESIALAGFLLMIPDFLLRTYPGRILNIHPSLLPAYGGKGMFGMNIHRAVIAAGDTQSGITVHLVSEECDGGKILFQAKTDIAPDDTPEILAAKIHELEYIHYPRILRETLL